MKKYIVFNLVVIIFICYLITNSILLPYKVNLIYDSSKDYSEYYSSGVFIEKSSNISDGKELINKYVSSKDSHDDFLITHHSYENNKEVVYYYYSDNFKWLINDEKVIQKKYDKDNCFKIKIDSRKYCKLESLTFNFKEKVFVPIFITSPTILNDDVDPSLVSVFNTSYMMGRGVELSKVIAPNSLPFPLTIMSYLIAVILFIKSINLMISSDFESIKVKVLIGFTGLGIGKRYLSIIFTNALIALAINYIIFANDLKIYQLLYDDSIILKVFSILIIFILLSMIFNIILVKIKFKENELSSYLKGGNL